MDRIHHDQSTRYVNAPSRELRPPKPFDSPVLGLVASSVRDESDLCGEVRERNEAHVFTAHRARLLRIARRMLGPGGEAEDLVQDVYLRWRESSGSDIASPVAFLVTITTRLCLDRLRGLKRERAGSGCLRLAEHVVDDHAPSPESRLEFSEEVSLAFLVVIERLRPEERAAFLLHDVLDYEYDEMAGMLGKSESACRQMIHRARARLRDPRARPSIAPHVCDAVVRKFLTAIHAGDRKAVLDLLAEDVACVALWINTHFLFDRTQCVPGVAAVQPRSLVTACRRSRSTARPVAPARRTLRSPR